MNPAATPQQTDGSQDKQAVYRDAAAAEFLRTGGDVLSLNVSDDGGTLTVRLCRRMVRLTGVFLLIVGVPLLALTIWSAFIVRKDLTLLIVGIVGLGLTALGVWAARGCYSRCRFRRTDGGFVFHRGKREIAIPAGSVPCVQLLGEARSGEMDAKSGALTAVGIGLLLATGTGFVYGSNAMSPRIQVVVERDGGVLRIDLRHIAKQRNRFANAVAVARFLGVPLQCIAP
jgi:hypothetical protein